MNRTDLIGLDTERTQRRLTAPFELRKDSGPTGGLKFKGYASTTEQEYPVYGGSFPGWMETVAAGSFRKTLREGADVSFLINHDGMSLARTKSGTMSLREDKVGLDVNASLDPRMGPVNDLFVASERGDIDEMSFAFRVTADQWFDDNGNASDSWEGTKRRITEINLHKGDVSAVNYGANDTTSGGFREIEMALAELRDGREITPKQREVIRGLARSIGEQPEQPLSSEQLQRFAQSIASLEATIASMRSQIDELTTTVEPSDPKGVTMFDGIEALAAARAQWELRLDLSAA